MASAGLTLVAISPATVDPSCAGRMADHNGSFEPEAVIRQNDMSLS
jgi:hypothetical protein